MALADDVRDRLTTALIPSTLHEAILGAIDMEADLTPKGGGSAATALETAETRIVSLPGLPREHLVCVNLGGRGWLVRWERAAKDTKSPPEVLGIMLLAGPAGASVVTAE